MADKNKQKSPPQAFVAESQRERWVKYGANVVLTCVVVVLLGAAVVYVAQAKGARKDMTAGGAYSLKPQTVKLIETLPQKVKIVGLFSRAERRQSELKVKEEDNTEVRYQQVADLLQEYQQKSGGKITVEMIDPITQPSKVDALFNEVAKKYGNDVNKYNDVLNAFPKTLETIKALAKQEQDALKKLPESQDRNLNRTIQEVIVTVAIFPQLLEQTKQDVDRQLELKVPDYKGAADAIRGGLEGLNDRIDAVLKRFTTAKEDKATPKEFQEYIAAAEPRYTGMKQAADDLLKKMEGLGQLKQLDELRQNKANSIAVMAETDMKVLPFASVFRVDAPRMMDAENAKPRFAGEQQISTALVTLTSKEKKKLAFVRSGGLPAALRMMQYEGPMSEVADRLREYNIEILEKDLSGQWAMQAMQMQMQGMPVPPEPTDEQLKDAVWVVLVSPQDPRQMMQNPAAGQLGPKVAEHLKNGGSAMVLVDPQSQNLDFLREWGIETRPEFVAVHEKIEAGGARSEDRTRDWQRQQPVFVLNQYGDHTVTRPLQSLDGFFVPLIPVTTVDAKGVKTTRILPVPANPKAWGETDFDSLRQGKPVEFNPTKAGDKEADLAPPLYGGAIAEKEDGKGRLIVIGSRTFAVNDYVQEPDIEVYRTTGRLVPRFPGNAELFVNGVFWLQKMDTMIAISPAALEVPRVAAMSDGVRNTWRVALIGLLPAGVVAAAGLVYAKRKD